MWRRRRIPCRLYQVKGRPNAWSVRRENQLELCKTKGVMVIGVNSVVDEQGITCNPCENLLSPGDYVMRINGQSVDDKKSMLELVQQSGGHELLLRVCRENEYRTVRVTPGKEKGGKLCAWTLGKG